MGKASSAKKVARAARAGGRSSAGRQRNLMFPGVIAGIVLFGSGLVAFAANDRKNDTTIPPIVREDHWHAAFGIYVCGEWQPDIPEFESPVGIHTHGDGVIHIHPFSSGGAGENATLGTFLEDTDVSLSDDELTIGSNELPDGEQTWKEGEDQCDGEDAELVVARWENVNSDEDPALITSGLGDLRFRGDGEGYTIAFVPEGETDIPKPPTAADLAQLGSVDAGAEAGSTTTTAGEGGSSTTTAGEGGTTTTTAGGTTTTAGS
jgi:hypothetical protein